MAAGIMFFCTPTWAQKPSQPSLGTRSVKLLKKGAYAFKDLNKNGKLDPYEDWRLPHAVRIQDLISKMSIEEKIGFMLISTTRLAGDYSFQPNAPRAEISSGFNEEDLVQEINMFSRKPLPYPLLTASGTTKGVRERHLRHFILRANTSVALTTKHFPGGGPQVEGQDPHFDWGKDQHYPGKMFEYHLKPFQAAIDAGTSAIMPGERDCSQAKPLEPGVCHQ